MSFQSGLKYQCVTALGIFLGLAGAGSVASAAEIAPAATDAQPAQQDKTSAAQEDKTSAQQNDSGSAQLTEIVVTATKRAGGERAQDVPAAVSAFSANQVENMHVEDLRSFMSATPNVVFTAAVNAKSANFAIRGSGVVSSDPGIEPEVGTFVNGVYLGVIQGQMTSMFDLESVEILRGPQGILFGRNVVGGAALINTRKPTEATSLNAKVGVESGPAYTAQAAGGGSLGGGFSGRLAVQYRKDEGYYYNEFLNTDLGKEESLVVRPSLRFQNGALDAVLVLEHGRVTGDGTVTTAGTDPRRVSLNLNGDTLIDWYSATLTTDLHVGLGDGVITNVLGWRKLKNGSLYDNDGTSDPISGVNTRLRQNQISNELRYNGTFGKLNLTTGVYAFHQNVKYRVEVIAPSTNLMRGSELEADAFGVFLQGDYDLTDSLTVTVGGRYNYERKRTKNANNGQCDLVTLDCTYQWLNPEVSFEAFVPKFGLNYKLSDNAILYATVQKAQRSGGYPLSYSNTAVPPASFNPESTWTYEAGLKSEWFDHRTRLNLAVFYSDKKDLQRASSVYYPALGYNVTQTFNAGEATFAGAEAELVQQVLPGLIVSGSVGYLDAKYKKVDADLNRDGVINAADKALKLPLAPEWTYNISAEYSKEFSFGLIEARVNNHYRSSQMYDVANASPLPSLGLWDASLNYSPTTQLTLSIYGKNLADKFALETNTAVGSGCACAIVRGRTVGVELRWEY
ncbi:TonB-dependent receptor [Altererythrobacter sp. FM1]|uniref:TonB-dependent receptor n=1 Tax=Tsuneonella flava TaxID=2055955 RepID=UPI000C8107A1|nr:TonB-dependent receptor [Tsuneonella flava]ROT97333.1 TonB-dependent receptor [Altererythrobacter sp. FM1]